MRKSTGFPKKRKKLDEGNDGNQTEPTTPEQDASEKEIKERKKLTAKRSIRLPQEKTSEVKETPQMRAVREKMLKKNEKNLPKLQNPKPSKEIVKSPTSKSSRSSLSTSKTVNNTTSKIIYTPQMQAIFQKIQDRASKSISKTKKSEESEVTTVKNKHDDLNKPRQLRRQNTSKEVQETVKTVKDKSTKKREDNCSPVEVIPMKRTRKSLKKNLAKERMEKLRKSLTLEISDVDSSDRTSQSSQSNISVKKLEKIPSIYKNAEVRLIRLKDRLSKDKSFSPKCLSTDQTEKVEKSPKTSVTTADDLVKRSYDSSFYEEMDWEPMEDEKITFEVQAVRTQLCTENHKDISFNVSSNILSSQSLLEHREKKQLYIVVDTNVFLSNIEAVELAKEAVFKTYDRPFIVIPWTVIRELDYIKDNHSKTKSATLCAKARRAVNYINKLFSSKHSRVIGQTREDVIKNKEKFSIDCPDDEILQTCLQIRDLEKSVVLLSYDVNLCNKAMIYDIATLGRNDPMEKVDYLNAVNYVQSSPCSLHAQDKEKLNLYSISILSQERRISDEIYDDAKSVIKDFLTVIVSEEMHDLYGESWEKRAIIRPPWTTVSVLQCAIKHWIAVVSESFLRKAESVLKELLQIFRDTSGERTLKEVSYTLNKCSDLIQMVNMNKHRELMLQASKRIDELKQKCHDLESQINEQKLHDAIGVENDAAERERRAQKAFQYFEAAYIFARDMCGVAAEVVGMPCSFHYNIPNSLPSSDYVKQIQPELAANVNRLLLTLSAVIEQVKDCRIDYRTLNNLYQTLITFLPESALVEMKRTNNDLAPLDVYCCVQQKIEVLKTGLRQLQELSTHFCRLASYRST
ncbi:swt1 RNA endoribonuclease isoform X2 [Calliopsis andreniformis]